MMAEITGYSMFQQREYAASVVAKVNAFVQNVDLDFIEKFVSKVITHFIDPIIINVV